MSKVNHCFVEAVRGSRKTIRSNLSGGVREHSGAVGVVSIVVVFEVMLLEKDIEIDRNCRMIPKSLRGLNGDRVLRDN